MHDFCDPEKAAVRKADLYIAVLPEETSNVVSAMLAKQLGARKTIARIDNNEYLEPNNKEMFINMGIDYLSIRRKPRHREVINLLGHTSTTEYVDFSGGKLSLVVFKIDAASPLIDKSLIEITGDRDSLPYRTVAISRDGETIIPRGNDRFQEGDNIYVIANQSAEKRGRRFLGQDRHRHQEHDDPRRQQNRGASSLRTAGRSEHQTGRLHARKKPTNWPNSSKGR